MARVLPDHELRKLLGSVLVDADEKCIKPNSIELRLGSEVRFFSTGETHKLQPGLFLKVQPGEYVLISSLEKLDFSQRTVQTHYPKGMMMALVTPTTTMMREGILQVATKVDAGFRGNLNWGLRNNATQEFIIGHGEPLFNITLFLLSADEVPNVPYGGSEQDTYQDTEGIKLSKRKIPAHIPAKSVISSGFEKLDHTQRLQEAGYPFSHIGSELTALQGNFELISREVGALKDQFKTQTESLSTKIESETRAISERLTEFRQTFLERVEFIFQQKFLWILGVLMAAAIALGAVCNFLSSRNVSATMILIIGLAASAATLAVTHRLSRRPK